MTSTEIAKIANVSRSTVSRVINGYSNVPESTRAKVQAVIDEYGYTPNLSARILAGKSNNIIGIFLADIAEKKEDKKWVGVRSPYNMELLSYFINFAKAEGYLTLVNTIHDLSECTNMEQYFENRSLFGGIFIGFPYQNKEIEALAQKGYNVVLVDQLSDEDDPENRIKRVNTDNEIGGFLATDHLIKQGHTKILHVSGDGRLSSKNREKGYQKAMAQAGLTETSVVQGFYLENAAYEATKAFLQEEKPTGIFAANDIMALGVIRAAEELGLSVPEDISLVGYDNLQGAEWMKLNLTTIDASKENLAKQAIESLFSKEMCQRVTPFVVERATVKKQ